MVHEPESPPSTIEEEGEEHAMNENDAVAATGRNKMAASPPIR
jgi:hypothetical protein